MPQNFGLILLELFLQGGPNRRDEFQQKGAFSRSKWSLGDGQLVQKDGKFAQNGDLVQRNVIQVGTQLEQIVLPSIVQFVGGQDLVVLQEKVQTQPGLGFSVAEKNYKNFIQKF